MIADLPLATLADLANFMDVPSVPTGPGTFALASASGVVRSYCNWQISYRAGDQIQVNGHGMPKVFLPSGYIVQVHSVALDFTPLMPIVWDGTVPGQYGYSVSQNGYLTRAPNWIWPEGDNRVTVVYDHGYWTDVMTGSQPGNVPTIPAEVVGVVCSVATRQLDNPESVRSRRVGELAEMYDGAALTAMQLSEGEKATLKQVRITAGPRP